MKIIADIIILILMILVKIGDSVLFIIGGIQKIVLFVKNTTQRLGKKFVLSLKKRTKTFKKPVLSIPKFSIPLPKIKQREKVQKAKQIVIFPLPFFTKLKYFSFGTFFSLIFIFVPLLIVIFIQDLPNPKTLSLSETAKTSKIYDRNGILLYQIYATQNRTIVPLSNIPEELKQATIAIEDKDFYRHPGFDISAIIRSAISNAQGGELQGGSTLTQQLIKSTLLTPETSIKRKVKEIILAYWAERIYSKDEILEMYFNQVPYGGTAWGIEAASELYFNKKVEQLTLAESAFLAGIPRAPSIYSPYGQTPNTWKRRQEEVLQRMVAIGYISQKQADTALSQNLTFHTPQTPIHAPHFVMYVKDLLIQKYGLPMVEKGGLIVTTSLDLKLQNQAQAIVREEVEKSESLQLSNGAAVVSNPQNGDILAMVGSKDFNNPDYGKVNVTTSLRQPGSSIKIVTYAAALTNGYTAATILDDSPITYAIAGAPAYTPVNYDGGFHGRIPLRTAFANSYNIPAVRTINAIGIPTMVNLGKKMGIQNWSDPQNYGLSITLGAAEATMLEMATVYGTVANSGYRVDINPFLKVTDGNGTVLEEKGKTTLLSAAYADSDSIEEGTQVLDSGVAFIISHILSDNNARAQAFGTNSILNIPNHTVSVKTGTTDNKRDNWTIGYTKDRVVTVWVGNNDNTPMSPSLTSGITGAAPIWNKIMTTLVQDQKNQPLIAPANVIQKPCLGRMEYFIKGTEQKAQCGFIPRNATPTPRFQ